MWRNQKNKFSDLFASAELISHTEATMADGTGAAAAPVGGTMFDPAVFISLQQKIDEDSAVREVSDSSTLSLERLFGDHPRPAKLCITFAYEQSTTDDTLDRSCEISSRR